MRIGFGYDIHAFGPGAHVTLGGVAIPHDRGVVAHSDGDVMLHALCDALLGAMGLGDIGQHFPDTDPRWKGVASARFVQALRGTAARARLAARQCRSHRCSRRARGSALIAARCATTSLARSRQAVERINIKATTCEGLGAIGRAEGPGLPRRRVARTGRWFGLMRRPWRT
jgi:2-C-methyl-D-erythritol 2,4-cyclodiphosphate synthase